MKSVCVYCGASPGKNPNFASQAIELITCLADLEIELIYGGASVGIMGVLGDTALEMGVKVTGVMPRSLVEREVSHNELDELIIVDSMHERKAKMMELSDGFIALPGGLGTLEELFEVLTWSQLRFHNKPCGLLNVDDYFEGLVKFLRNAVDQDLIKQQHLDCLKVSESPHQLLGKMIE